MGVSPVSVPRSALACGDGPDRSAPRRPRTMLVVALLAPALAGCMGLFGGPAQSVDVLATHHPLAFVADRITGENVTTGALFQGHLPHDWQPSVRDVQRIEASLVYLAQGAGMDWWLDGVVGNLGEDAPRVVTTTANVTLIDHAGAHEEDHQGEAGDRDEGGDIDSHTWTDPLRLAQQARAAEAGLSETWPEHADAFSRRAEDLDEDLRTLDAAYDRRIAEADCRTRTVVVNHNAWAYAAQRYNFTVAAVHGLSPETEPSAETLDELAQLVDEHNISVVFFEAFASSTVAEALAEETGATAEVLHPLGGRTDEQRETGRDYEDLMRENLEKLEEAMGCQIP